MKILFGSIVVDARGRLNGHVFKKTATGHAITKLALPRNRDQWQQNRQVGQMAKVLAHYKQLNSRDRNRWAVFAEQNPIPNKFGVPVNIGARAMYQKVTFGLSFPISTYPSGDKVNALIPATQVTALGVNASTGRIAFDVMEFTSEIILNVWVQQTAGAVTTPPQNGWRRIPNLIILDAGVAPHPSDIRDVLVYPLLERTNWVKFQICNAHGFGLYNHIQQLTID